MSANALRILSTSLQSNTCTILTLPFRLSAANYRFPPFNHQLNSCTSLSHLKLVHALIITTGSRYNFLLSTKLISLYANFSSTMDYARKLFDNMSQRDVFLWNTLIRGYSDLGPCHEALILYKNMHNSCFLPDDYTFPFVLRSCAVILASWEGRQVHCNVIKLGFNLDMIVQTALLSMYAQCGDTFSMERASAEMSWRNIVSWTALIAGYVQNGLFSQGLTVFEDMVRSGTQPNSVTLISVLPACSGLGFLNLGKLIHAYGLKLGLDSDITLTNALIALYGKCGNLHTARLLFDGMPVKNLVSWNAMIATYEQNNAGRDAIKLFRRMLCERVQYDYISILSVISACTSLGALGTGKWLHELVKRKQFETNISVMNALIDMYGKCGYIELAKDVFEKLHHRNVVSWTSIIGACASHGHVDDALKLFSKMKEEGIKPNSFTFTSVLTACRHSGLVEEGKKHFDSMAGDYSIVPCVEQCACMVDLLGRAGCLLEAYEFIRQMPVAPDSGVWGALLGACRIHGNVELAELVTEQLSQLDPQTSAPYILMSHVYAEAGRWEDVVRLRNLMEERELRKVPGRSSVEANKRFHTFLAGLRSQPSWATQ
ncbi:pentatricopeptide repeat-containing protein At1g08070, chloroplastic-like [Euphorbia lathyris]|uniref:pentatricopeptide repeat-containing protein At1g08070, chloroplastic-like n=1 Tax=Euphorbia lathyris TaxID=212925 RepID=UPI003313A02D